MIVLVFITLITNGIIDNFPVNLSQTTASFLENAPFFIIVLSVFSSLSVIGLTAHDYTPVVEEHKRNEEHLSVYHRLRYVEAANIVFDPKSMNGCYAERKLITLLGESCVSK